MVVRVTLLQQVLMEVAEEEGQMVVPLPEVLQELRLVVSEEQVQGVLVVVLRVLRVHKVLVVVVAAVMIVPREERGRPVLSGHRQLLRMQLHQARVAVAVARAVP